MAGMNFFIITPPNARLADYCLGCLEGSVYIDFDNYNKDIICLRRISFDGYGCCNLEGQIIPLNLKDSHIFKELYNKNITDQDEFERIVRNTIADNKHLIWEDALNKYKFL